LKLRAGITELDIFVNLINVIKHIYITKLSHFVISTHKFIYY